MTNGKFALALHGGAGASRKLDYRTEIDHMTHVAEMARDRLRQGDSALDVATHVVAEMEDSGFYVAGKGGSPNLAGDYELDAAVMDGRGRRAGAVAALQGFRNPVHVARMVMDVTPHVLLVGEGARKFAEIHGAAAVPDDPAWFTHAAAGESNYAAGVIAPGTVGCVIRDQKGALAAATSSAGVFDKVPGRVGDSPLIGAGCWADDQVAVSCTGQGELFIRAAVAARIAFAVKGGEHLPEAVSLALEDVRALGGEGGVIAVDHCGNVHLSCNAEGMKRAWLAWDGSIRCRVFD